MDKRVTRQRGNEKKRTLSHADARKEHTRLTASWAAQCRARGPWELESRPSCSRSELRRTLLQCVRRNEGRKREAVAVGESWAPTPNPTPPTQAPAATKERRRAKGGGWDAGWMAPRVAVGGQWPQYVVPGTQCRCSMRSALHRIPSFLRMALCWVCWVCWARGAGRVNFVLPSDSAGASIQSSVRRLVPLLQNEVWPRPFPVPPAFPLRWGFSHVMSSLAGSTWYANRVRTFFS